MPVLVCPLICLPTSKFAMTELNDDDVIEMSVNLNFAKSHLSTFAQLKQGLRDFLKPVSFHWLNDGIECRVLKTTGGGWQKGRFRLRLEFVPDNVPEPESKTDKVS